TNGTGFQMPDGAIDFVYILGAALNNAQKLMIAEDFYGPFRMRVPMAFFVPAGGVDINVPLHTYTLADNQTPIVDIGVNILSPLQVFSFIQSIPTVDIGIDKLSTVVFADQNYYQPPFEIGGAKYGVFCSTDFLKIYAMKTTVASPSDTDWSNQDGAITLAGSSAVKSLWVVEAGSDLYIATQQVDGRVAFHVFDPGADTWLLKDDQVATVADTNFDSTPTFHGVSIAVRNDGDAIIFYTYHETADNLDGILYGRREGGTWTADIIVFAPDTVFNFKNPVLIGPDSSDRITCVVRDELNTFPGVVTKSLSAANTLSGDDEIDISVDNADFIVAPGVIDDANLISVPYINSDDKISVGQFTSAAVPSPIDLRLAISDNIVEGNGATVLPFVVACLALNSSTPILLYADDATQDLWKDGNALVGETDTEELDAVTINRVSCLKGTSDLLVFYDDAGTTKFLAILIGPTINVPLQLYTLSDNQIPTIEINIDVPVPLQVYTLLDNQVPQVGTSVSITSPLHIFTFIQNIPQVGTSALILVPLEIFNLIPDIPIVGSGVSIASPLQVFNLIPFIPEIAQVDIKPPAHIYTFDDNQIPQVGTSALVTVPLQIFNLIDFIPDIILILEIKPPLHIYS
ncbi:hypothetical protein LCGC14_2191410, partial [marine sediment metagenome]